MAAEKDKPDDGAAGPETSLSPINRGAAWAFIDKAGLNTPRDGRTDDYRRTQQKIAMAEWLNKPDSAERASSASAVASIHEDIDPEIVERVARILAADEARKAAFMRALFGGETPDWLTDNTRTNVCTAFSELSARRFTDAEILEHVARAREPEDCVAALSHEVMRELRLLANVQWAVSLGPDEGRSELYGRDASRGFRSREGSQKKRGLRWYTEPLRCFVADMASKCMKQPPTLPEWEAAAREFCEAQFWTQDGIEFYLSDDDNEKTGEQKTVVVAQLRGKSGETLKTKTLTLRQIYAHFPKFPA
jgi:hypothetical protein